MKIKIEHEITASEIQLTEQELLEHFIKQNKYSMFNVVEKALNEVSWMNNRPKSTKLEWVAMLSKHIEIFMSEINHNDDLSVG